MTTIKDVAGLAGVSHGTVTNVINNNPSVNIEIRERVLKSIDVLGYVPNEYARSLRAGKGRSRASTNNIGCIVEGEYAFAEPYFVNILEGIARETINSNHHLYFNYTAGQLLANPGLFLKMVNSQRIDGLLLIGVSQNNEIFGKIQEAVSSIVCLNISSNEGVDSVDADRFRAGYEAVRYLYALGHKRIGFIGYRRSGEYCKVDKFKGYNLAMNDLNLRYDKNIVEGEPYVYGVREGFEYMSKILARANPLPTAVFADSDLLAIGAIKAINEKGLKVPEDISIISFDDIEEARYVSPALTTFGVRKEEMGSIGVKRLLERVENPDMKPIKITIPAELIVRESCAAPKGV